jgi:subtilisin family serine protease
LLGGRPTGVGTARQRGISKTGGSGPLDLVSLSALTRRTAGRSDLRIGLIDGPVALDHPAFVGSRIELVSARHTCNSSGAACAHGTFIAGILSGQRESGAPALCPDCSLLVRPIFTDHRAADGTYTMPSATIDELTAAIHECLAAGANLLNISAALLVPTPTKERALKDALNAAMVQGAIVVAAAGNQGMLGSTAITRHPWVIPVSACDHRGWPLSYTNLGHSVGRRGLLAPGEGTVSLLPVATMAVGGGTSVATALVSAAVALLWSAVPAANATQVRLAVTHAHPPRGIVPPLLDAWKAWQALIALVGVPA